MLYFIPVKSPCTESCKPLIFYILHKVGNICFPVQRCLNRERNLCLTCCKLHFCQSLDLGQLGTKSRFLPHLQSLKCLNIVKWANFLRLTTNNTITAQNLLQRRTTCGAILWFLTRLINYDFINRSQHWNRLLAACDTSMTCFLSW